MEIFTYFCMYFMLLLASTPLISGWFAITRGYTQILPSGAIKRSGKLLSSWYFFWFKERKETRKMIYEGSELNKLVLLLKHGYGINVFSVGEMKITLLYKLDADLKFRIENEQGIIIDLQREVDKEYDYWLIKEYPEYVYPEWARSMMAGCITCHASFYGSLIYWSFFFLVGKSNMQESMFAFCPDNFVLAVILTWGAFCISLAALLPIIWKKID